MIPGHQDTRIPGYQDTRIPGYQDTRILGYQDTRLQGYQDCLTKHVMKNVRLVEQKLFWFGLVGFPGFYNVSISIFLSLGSMSERYMDLGKQRFY